MAATPPLNAPAARAPLSDRFGQDWALLAAYSACFAIVLVLLPLGGTLNWAEVGPALALQLVVGIALAFASRLRAGRHRFVGMAGVLAYLMSVALLRDGATATAGYGPLVLLPVAWASLRGRRKEFVAAVVGVAVVYLVPAITIGPPQYPSGGWRAGLLFVVLSTVLGLAIMRLVGRVAELVEQLDWLARSDELTGLPNRRAWRELVDHELAVARRSREPLTIALLDLDRFKHYNDEHGHLAGDRLLRSATAAWRTTLRETDALARWGGDEFGLLMPACDIKSARVVLDRMRAACPYAPFSVGLAEWDHRSTPEAVLALADRALYSAKHAGREADSATVALA